MPTIHVGDLVYNTKAKEYGRITSIETVRSYLHSEKGVDKPAYYARWRPRQDDAEGDYAYGNEMNPPSWERGDNLEVIDCPHGLQLASEKYSSLKHKATIIGAVMALAGFIAWFVLGRMEARKQAPVQSYASGDGEFSITLDPYDGDLKGNPKVVEFQRSFEKMALDATEKIRKKTGLPDPNISIHVILDDSFDADPYLSPSSGMECPFTPYSKGKGNCNRYDIRFGTKNIANGFLGRSKPDKFLTHELTHVYMFYNIPDIDKYPSWYTEGWPIHVAEQAKELKKVQTTETPKPENSFKYKPTETQVHTYGKLVDQWEKHYLESPR